MICTDGGTSHRCWDELGLCYGYKRQFHANIYIRYDTRDYHLPFVCHRGYADDRAQDSSETHHHEALLSSDLSTEDVARDKTEGEADVGKTAQ
jgi:hypothetical protein